MSIKNVSIVGGSGNIGRAVLPELLKSVFSITIITRSDSSAAFPEGLNVIKSDFSLKSLTDSFRGQDAVISMLHIMALDRQRTVIDAAIAAGVRRFIPSEYGSDSMNPAVIAAVPFFEAKKKDLEYLISKEDLISWTALFTGPFFDWGLSAGFLGFDLAKKTVTLVDGGETPFTTSNVAQIGRALVAVLGHATETINKPVYVESFTTTQLEVLAALEKTTEEKWTVVEARSDSIRAEGLDAMSEGKILEGGAKLITAAVFSREALENHVHVEGGIWNERLGLPKEILDVEVKRVLQLTGSG